MTARPALDMRAPALHKELTWGKFTDNGHSPGLEPTHLLQARRQHDSHHILLPLRFLVYRPVPVQRIHHRVLPLGAKVAAAKVMPCRVREKMG